jgi:ferredoxin
MGLWCRTCAHQVLDGMALSSEEWDELKLTTAGQSALHQRSNEAIAYLFFSTTCLQFIVWLSTCSFNPNSSSLQVIHLTVLMGLWCRTCAHQIFDGMALSSGEWEELKLTTVGQSALHQRYNEVIPCLFFSTTCLQFYCVIPYVFFQPKF